MMILTLLLSLLSSPSFASDGTGDTMNPGVIDFFKLPRLPAKPDTRPFDPTEEERRNNPIEFYKQGRAGKPVILRCSQYQSRSPYAFNAKCGLGYTAVQLYVRSSDVRHCYVGVSCVANDSGSNH